MDDSASESQTAKSSSESIFISDRLYSLIDRWETLIGRGDQVDIDALCGGDRDLAASMGQYIDKLESFARFEDRASESTPDLIGPYRVIREIGRGGFSIVYLVEQQLPDRKIALKLLNDVKMRPRLESRFRLEIQLLATLRHQNIARIYDAGVAELSGVPRPFFTMEWIDGENILQFVRGRQTEPNWGHQETIELSLGYLDALADAHSEGVIHRDLKPANMLVDADGSPKLIDFGLARILRAQDGDDWASHTAESWAGTRCYMSPEQFGGSPSQISAQTDIYAFGVVLYQLLTDCLPYQLDNLSMWQTAEVIRKDLPTPLRRHEPRLGRDLELILETALAKEPSDRYESVDAFRDDLKRYLDGRPIFARRENAFVAFVRWSRKHRRAASLAGFVLLVAVSLAILAASWARVANDRATRLARANESLETQRQTLGELNRQYANSNKRLRRTAFGRSLLRLGTLLEREPDQVISQLNDRVICPPDLRGFAWRFLNYSTQRTIATWDADDGLLDIATADDASWVATSGPGGVRVWDVESRKMIASFTEHIASPSVRMAVDSSSRCVFFVNRDGKPMCLDVKNNSSELMPWVGDGRVTAIAAAGNERSFVAADESGLVARFDGGLNRFLWQAQLSDHAIVCVAVSSDRSGFGLGSKRGELSIGELESGTVIDNQVVVTKAGTTTQWDRVRFSADLGVASLSKVKGQCIVWDLNSQAGRHVYRSAGFYPDIDFIDVPSESRQLRFVRSARKEVIVCENGSDLSTLYRARLIDYESDSPTPDASSNDAAGKRVSHDPIAVDVSRNGLAVAIALRGGRVVVRFVDARPAYVSWPTPRATVSKLVCDEQRNRIAVVSGGGQVMLYDAGSGEMLREWTARSRSIPAVKFLLGGRILATHDRGVGLSFWDTMSGKMVTSIKVDRSVFRFLEYQNRLLIGSAAGKPIWIEIVESGEAIQVRGGEQDVDSGILSGAISTARGVAATYDASGKLRVWEIGKDEGGEPNDQELSDRVVPDVRVVRFSPSGEFLVTGDANGIVSKWSVPDLELLGANRVSTRAVGGLGFASDGMTMATSHFDGEILFWDIETWEPQLSLRTDAAPIRDLLFDASGRRLIAGGKSSALMVFETPLSVAE